jgi:hypothetical protein
MPVTYAQLVDRVKQQLLGYTRDQASISYLTADITDPAALTFVVDPDTANNLSRGLIEVNDELMLAKKIDRTSATVTVMGTATAVGRGVEGTVATTHAEGSLVTNDPRFPRARIKEAINDSINGVYPDLWVFDQFEFPYLAARYEYPVPAAVEDVYKVVSNTIGPSGVWFPVQKWRLNVMASTTSGQVKPSPTPTGKTIQVYDFIVPGRNVRVSYTKKPTTLTLENQDFELTTGLPERVVDLITFGACWRLIPAYEAARLQQSSIETTERAPLVNSGAASAASQYFMALYSKRLAEERTRMQRLFETYTNFNG